MPREPAPLHEAGGLCLLSNGALPFYSSPGKLLTVLRDSSSIFDRMQKFIQGIAVKRGKAFLLTAKTAEGKGRASSRPPLEVIVCYISEETGISRVSFTYA